MVDNLALVYNKRLFAQAGLAPPTPNWTWSDFENAAMKLTDPAKKQFGWAYVNDASEDTVWRYWAMLWQAGGSILTPDGKHAAFNSASRAEGPHTPADPGEATTQSTSTTAATITWALFTSGHIGMLYTGPWDLGSIIQGNQPYGVQILPANLNHQTISGPDNWVVFNNGSAHVKAVVEFLKWLTSPAIDLKWSLMTGDLPIRAGVTQLAGYQQFVKKYPGIGDVG